jgi:ferrous iron transport protein A
MLTHRRVFPAGKGGKRMNQTTLDRMPIGKRTRILEVRGQGALRRRLLDMGLTPHTEVMIRKVAPLGDPIEIQLRGYELTLRMEDARNIVTEGGSAT